MKRSKTSLLALSAALSFTHVTARAAEPEVCMSPRLSDIGWTDISATTAVTASLLSDLGYKPAVKLLSVAVTFQSLKNKDIDVFLGNWMPAQAEMRKPYLDDHSIDDVTTNLTGAKYTLAVPTYTYDAGLKSFDDIAKFGDQLGDKIYGIEPGSGGNKKIQDMLSASQFGLHGFSLVESSEQGMLSEFNRKYRQKQPILILGWEPHPMNVKYKISYLLNGDSVFGANYGAATVDTLVRSGYAAQCPNIGRLLSNLKFDLVMEDTIMQAVLDNGTDPKVAGRAYLKANPGVLDGWLDGVTTTGGEPALPAVKKALGL